MRRGGESLMRKRRLLALLIGSTLTFLLLSAGTEPAPPFAEAVASITSAELQSDLYFLASDEMQGREINTPFNDIAALYLAHRFQSMGLQPVEDGAHFQYFTLVHAKLGKRNRLRIRHSKSSFPITGTLKKDYFPFPLSAEGSVKAPLVFAGYGITAPEHDYDDYQELAAHRKIVVIMRHEPGENDPQSPFDGLLDSKYSEDFRKVLNAQDHGAAGVILVPDTANHSRRSNFSRRAKSVWPEDPSQHVYALKIWAERIRIPVLFSSAEFADRFLDTSGSKLDEIQKKIDQQHRPHSFELSGVEVTLEASLTREQTRVRNVLAYLPGSDPKLKEEVVVVSAHFDHVGSRDGEIFNGADDDGSGTVGLLEVAQAYSLSPERPKRSLLFAAWNAEEHGLLGSRYYVQKPLFPLAKTVAVFQMDMIGRNEEIPDPTNPRYHGLEKQTAAENTNSVNILGYTRSNDLRDVVAASNRYVGLELKFRYDNNSGNLLRRSDNWPFLVHGVPALFFHTGLHPDYHQPTDTPEKINYAKLEKVVRLVFLSSWNAANMQEAPRLNTINQDK